MKKQIISLLLVLCMCLLPMLCLTACDADTSGAPDGDITDNGGEGALDGGEKPAEKLTFTPVFASATYTYDGEEKSLTVTGVPEGVTVIYEGNGKSAAGVYEVKAAFYDSSETYKVPAPMTATLTIQKASIAGLSFTDETLDYDGYSHYLFINGELPDGVTVSYTGNGRSEAGTHTVTATFSDSTGNYELPDPMTATLTILPPKTPSDPYGRETDDLPQGLNYKFDMVRVLHWRDHSQMEYDIETISADNVDNAIYERNQEIQRRLNIELDFQGEQGNYSNASSFVARVAYNYESRLYGFDLISAHSLTMTMLATRGYLLDMNDVATSYLNFEKPWWPSNMQDELALGDGLYTVTGDMSTKTLWNMEAVFFNQTRLKYYWNDYAAQQSYTDAVAMVYDWAKTGKWTLDNMISLTRGADGSGLFEDRYSIGVKDKQDVFGFATTDFYMASFYTAAGLRLVDEVTVDVLGDLHTSFDSYGSESAAALVTKLAGWMQEQSCFADSHEVGGGLENFEKGRAMLTVCSLEAYDGRDKTLFGGGMLPMPKQGEGQTGYHTGLDGADFSLYGIYRGLPLRGADKQETYTEMTAVLECWASESYRLITPEIYERVMASKYAENEDMTAMFELVRGSVTLDYGTVLYHGLGTRDTFNGAVMNGDDWTDIYSAAAMQEKWEELYFYTLMGYSRN